jgi:hypothetical protein
MRERSLSAARRATSARASVRARLACTTPKKPTMATPAVTMPAAAATSTPTPQPGTSDGPTTAIAAKPATTGIARTPRALTVRGTRYTNSTEAPSWAKGTSSTSSRHMAA